MIVLRKYKWQRDSNNPVLRPNPNSTYDCTCCMSPFVMQIKDEYRLYYAGADRQGYHRICLATSLVANPTKFTRYGVILDIGKKGDFDGFWCVSPCVHKFGNKWYLYYTGNDGSNSGLQAFSGIGLAIGDDGIHFERYDSNPIITGDQTKEYPHNRGIAGPGGTILEDIQTDGSIFYRMYYTLAVGTLNSDPKIDQKKLCAVCHSIDGIHWSNHRIIMNPREDVSNEDIAVAGPFVWRDTNCYRMFYCGIGSRWGYYSISEAVSQDGYKWYRGEKDENLTLTPGEPGTWESQMVEYPSVIEENGKLRLFYCGNGYGTTGIGTAVTLKKGSRNRN